MIFILGIIIGIFLVVIILLYVFFVVFAKPLIHKNITIDDLKRFFKTIYFRGYNGGYLVIAPMKGNRKIYLQFRKEIEKKGVKIELCIPLQDWCKPYYSLIHDYLTKSKISFTENEGRSNSLTYTYINCKNDIDFCIQLTKEIYQNVFKYDITNKFRCSFINVSPHDEKIGF